MGENYIGKMHGADLATKYNPVGQGLDIVEMAAIFGELTLLLGQHILPRVVIFLAINLYSLLCHSLNTAKELSDIYGLRIYFNLCPAVLPLKFTNDPQGKKEQV